MVVPDLSRLQVRGATEVGSLLLHGLAAGEESAPVLCLSIRLRKPSSDAVVARHHLARCVLAREPWLSSL